MSPHHPTPQPFLKCLLIEYKSVKEGISITGSFSFGNMSAIFVRDPDRTVIELDAYSDADTGGDGEGYSNHPD